MKRHRWKRLRKYDRRRAINKLRTDLEGGARLVLWGNAWATLEDLSSKLYLIIKLIITVFFFLIIISRVVSNIRSFGGRRTLPAVELHARQLIITVTTLDCGQKLEKGICLFQVSLLF